jgi:hypothetical protein
MREFECGLFWSIILEILTIIKSIMFSRLKKVFFGGVVSFVACFVFLGLIGLEGNVAYANTCTSQVTGSWATVGTWTGCGGVAPQVGDSVVIANTHNVTIVTGSINTVTDITIQTGGTLTQGNTSTQTILGDLTVQTGGTLKHGNNSNTHAYELDFVAVNIDIQLGATVTADALGYGTTPNDTDGYGTSGGLQTTGGVSGSGGGANCGDGGDGSNNASSGGTAYCTIANLNDLGSSGGGPESYNYGGAGGGLIILNASTTLTINGTITADGGVGAVGFSGTGAGGGAGGSISLIASTVAGTTGSLTATGADGNDINDDGGGGGGGGVYILYGSAPSGLPSVDVTGGTGPGTATNGGAGTYTSAISNTAPTVATTPTFSSQATDATGYVTFRVGVDDADDNELSVQVEYSDDGGSSWYDPWLISAADTSGDGDPSLNNGAATYQLTTVKTSDGENTLTIVWDTQSASNGNGSLDDTDQSDIQVRITPNDVITDGTATASTSFTVDNVSPTGLSNFALTSQTSTTATFTWTAVSAEDNFANYEIWYDTTAGITQGDDTETEWDDSDDGLLTTMATATTTITGLDTTTNTYCYNLWAMDDYGNSVSQTEQCSAATPGVSTVNAPTTSSLDVTLDTNGNAGTTTFAIEESGSGNYIQADSTLGGPAVWQTNATWGTITLTGLDPDAAYTLKANARNTTNIETGLGTASSALYTLANTPGAPTVTAASSTTQTIVLDANSNPSTTTFAIQETTGLDYVQADGTIDATEVFQTNATWGTVTVTGLSVDTAYTFKVKAKNGDTTQTAFGTAASAVYTFVNPPNSPLASVSGSSIAVSWGANSNPAGTAYYVTRSDGTVMLNWGDAMSLTDSGPTCGTGYTYTIKARNTSLVESTTVTTSTAVVPCGGGVVIGISGGSGRSGRNSAPEPEPEPEPESESGEGEGEGEGEEEGEGEGEEDEEEVRREPVYSRTEEIYEAAEPFELVEVHETMKESVEKDRFDSDRESVVEELDTGEAGNLIDRLAELLSEGEEEIDDDENRDEDEVDDVAEDRAEENRDSTDWNKVLENLVEEGGDEDRDDEFNDEIKKVLEEFENDGDVDYDGISNEEEIEQGTDPYFADTDGDGVPDGVEREMETDPTDPNSIPDLINNEIVAINGSQDTDGDGISDVIEVMTGTDPENTDDNARDRFFGETRSDGAPTVTVGTLRNIVSVGEGGGMLSGNHIPNSSVTVNVKNLGGIILKTIEVDTDDEGKFVTPLSDFDEGTFVVTVESGGVSGKSVVMEVKEEKEVYVPEFEVVGLGIEVLDEDEYDDLDEFDYEVARPSQWHRIVMEEYVSSYIEGTTHANMFVSALEDLKVRNNDNARIFAGVATPRTRIVFYFESLITTSVVIADADGQFEIPMPKGFEVGFHKYTGFEINLASGKVSAPVRGILSMVNTNRMLDDLLAKFVIR